MIILTSVDKLGCPRNNQIFFSVRTETNRNSICFGCFSVCFAKPKLTFFRFVLCFGPVSKQTKQTKLCRYKLKQTEKISKKRFILGDPRNSKNFFLGLHRNKPKLNLFRLFFCLFFATQIFFLVCYGVSDRYRNNRNKQSLWYRELKRLIF